MRRAVLVPAALAVAALAAPPPSTGWVVVRKDGARVTFAGKPALRSGALVGRLSGDGTLVSIAAASVDDEATLEANAPGPFAAPSPASPRIAPTPGPFATPALGDRVRLRTSAEEAGRILEGSRKGGTAPAPSPTGRRAGEGDPASAEPTDLLGRGEAFWRARAAAARAGVEEASEALSEAEARLAAAERAYLGGSRAERTTFVLRVNEARAAADRAREERRRAETVLEGLQETARKSGAFPGWLR